MAHQQYGQYTILPAPAAGAAPSPYAPAPQTYDPNVYAVPQYAPAPQPAYQAVPAYNTYAGGDEIRTIFVTGFPPDVKERELTNMCRFLPGFEATAMKQSQHGVPQGFVLFRNGVNAHSALNSLTGLPFEDGFTLRCEMAKKNMYVRNDERPAKAYRPSHSSYGAPGMAGAGYPGYDRNSENPPCDTLFIGNLSVTITDADVENYFREVAGDKYDSCKVMRGAHGRVSALVKFIDTPTAQEIFAAEQGKEMPNSDRGPMRIQFSKNPLNSFGGGKRPREESAPSYGVPGGPIVDGAGGAQQPAAPVAAAPPDVYAPNAAEYTQEASYVQGPPQE